MIAGRSQQCACLQLRARRFHKLHICSPMKFTPHLGSRPLARTIGSLVRRRFDWISPSSNTNSRPTARINNGIRIRPKVRAQPRPTPRIHKLALLSATQSLFAFRESSSTVVYIPWTLNPIRLTLSTVRKANRIAGVFGKVLREQRRGAGLSQEALALTAEVDRTFVSQMERGIRQPTLTTLWKLAAALNVKPSVFVQKMERTIR